MFQADIQMLYSLQIDNGISQCVKNIWTGIFKNKFAVHGQNWNREAVLASKGFKTNSV